LKIYIHNYTCCIKALDFNIELMVAILDGDLECKTQFLKDPVTSPTNLVWWFHNFHTDEKKQQNDKFHRK